ncbi:hypothetical protein C0583_03090 [Candidatus Parcubacteria bacterium]|nr:MAG: hypothetical protein C0583_03090 [Candidatus Parcubacteria bacterium]
MASQALVDFYIQLHLLFYWLIFLLSYGESFVVIGLFVPGSISLILSGYLSAKGFFDFGDLFFFATLGAIAGDYTSYYLGRIGAFTNKNSRFFLVNESKLAYGKDFFYKHGTKSVFWGRFIGLLRPIIPFVAGIFKMDEKKFLFWNIFSGILWAFSHLIIGFFFYHTFIKVSEWFSTIIRGLI